MTDRAETHLVLRAQMGDRAAMNELLSRAQSWLHRYLVRLIGEGQRADDVLQDVFVLLCRKLRHLDEPSAWRAWVYRIATREAARAAGGRRERELTDAEAERLAAEAEAPALGPDERAALWTRVEALPDPARAVLVLHYSEDLPLAEVAAVLGKPLGTVKSRLAAGLARMRADLGALHPERRAQTP